MSATTTTAAPAARSPLAAHWTLDPAVTFLNHGSFGACPRVVLARQDALRAVLEREPVRFMVRDLEPLLDAARARLGALLGASGDDLAFVPNPTTAVNTVLRALDLAPGDELLTTDHEYNACKNALDAAAARAGARVVVATIPLPVSAPEQVVEAVMASVTDRTRFALLDHVTSPTALVLPIEPLVRALAARGVDTMVDGAHAPGMVPLALDALGAAYYTGTCHKWLCAPKGAAFFHVRRDRQPGLRPLVISHGANSPRTDRSRFRLEFDWMGTDDPTPYLCVPAAIDFLESLFPDGLTGLMAHNRALALWARDALDTALGAAAPLCPPSMVGSMAVVALPDAPAPSPSVVALDPLQDALWHTHAIEVPVVPWPAPPRRLLRVSAQAYNTREDYARLADALTTLLGRAPARSNPGGS